MTDRDVVEAICCGDREVTEYFFFIKCDGLLRHIAYSVFNNRVEVGELISELYLYIAADDWRKLRQFDFRSRLSTWITVVAVRFFQKKREALKENDSSEALIERQPEEAHDPIEQWTRHNDLYAAIERMSNERYRQVIMMIDIEGLEPKEAAMRLQTTTDNLYNLRHRAHMQLAAVLGRKEDWI